MRPAGRQITARGDTMITFTHKGNFNKTDRFFKSVSKSNYFSVLERYGREGVATLASVTPVDSGLTASSWQYNIHQTLKGLTISWTNAHVVAGVPIAIILQYGHGTRNGGWVQGRDYINPVIQPIFDKIANEIWKGVIAK